jgi:hypothetical protein
VGFEPKISAVERLHTYALDRADNGTGKCGFFGRKTKIKIFETQTYFKGHKIFCMFMKNSTLKLVIYSLHKAAPIMNNDGDENKKCNLPY